jgi:hypothetical protein
MMNIKSGKARSLGAALVILISIAVAPGPAWAQPKLKEIFSDAAGYPKQVWTRLSPAKIVGVDMASKTGEVVYNTDQEVFYLKDKAEPVWTAGKGQGWKLVQDLAISWDGSRVFFQTDLKEKVSTETKTLTLHLLDADGKEIWAKENPLRYQNFKQSPSGKYLLQGEATQVGVTCYDDNLKQLWQKDIWFWALSFDPLEHYLFDGEGGNLYKVTGEQTWDFGPRTRILSVSDNSNYLLTSQYRMVKTTQRMFLTGREALKKIELASDSGCVSRDGALTSYINANGVLGVYNTQDLLANPAAAPLFKTPFKKAFVMQIARDNRSLLVMGQETELSSAMTLIDLNAKKIAWKKRVDDALRIALPTDDNKFIVIKSGDNSIVKYQAY